MQSVRTATSISEQASPYTAYSYSYPHKTAYRTLSPPVALSDVWQMEHRDALFLYMHIPFCEMRCGFCNLFTTTNASEDFVSVYLRALERQARVVSDALAPARFARMAIGGGTPTFIDAHQLDRLFDLSLELFGIDPRGVPTSIETSPQTAEPQKLRVLKERGVSRVSIGVQSFVDREVRSVGRAQRAEEVLEALNNLKECGFPTINVDLIYGIPEQTRESWLYSIEQALAFDPEEIYLYPLYVRPLTGLGRASRSPEPADRLSLYRWGRDYLLERGYRQLSMRMFQSAHAPQVEGPVYCCQTDGMVGIGCGARSYASSLHYAGEYAVSAKPVRSIIDRYMQRDDSSFSAVDLGFALDDGERKRRFLIQSLLQVEGLDVGAYEREFKSGDPRVEFRQFGTLIEEGLIEESNGYLRLTVAGLELSDQVGVLFYSQAVNQRMQESTVL